MKMIQRIDEFRRLWGMIISPNIGKVDLLSAFNSTTEQTIKPVYEIHIPCPVDAQIWRWMRFDDDVLEHGLGRLRTKVMRKEITDADGAGRYLTAVFCAEAKRRVEIGVVL